MSRASDIYDAHQRARFMRTDVARWMRPDAARFIRPDVKRFLKPGTDPADVFLALDRKYSPNQRRVPAGRTGGGRWTDEAQSGGGDGFGGGTIFGGGGDSSSEGGYSDEVVSGDSGALAYSEEIPKVLIDTTNWVNDDVGQPDEEVEPMEIGWRGPKVTDSAGNPYYNQGGHHEMPRGVFDKWDLSPEVRQIFNDSTTGRLAGTLRTHPDGTPMGKFLGRSQRSARQIQRGGIGTSQKIFRR